MKIIELILIKMSISKLINTKFFLPMIELTKLKVDI